MSGGGFDAGGVGGAVGGSGGGADAGAFAGGAGRECAAETLNTGIATDGGKNTARINLKLVPRADRSRTQKQVEQAIRKRVAGIPGVDLRVGWGGPIYVALLGNNDAEMNRVMLDVKEKVAKIQGVTDIEITVKEGTPALSIRLKPELAAEYGITHMQLGSTLRAMVGGENSGYWLAPDGQNYEVITQLPRINRTVVDDIANLNLATGRTRADGTTEVVPLRAIATNERTFNPENIRRQDLQRRIALWANVEGRPSGDAGKEVQQVRRPRLIGEKTTHATASFAAAAAIHARLLGTARPERAAVALAAARHAWQFVAGDLQWPAEGTRYRNWPGMHAGEYCDASALDNRMWAAAELLRTTGEPQYLQFFEANFAKMKLDPTGEVTYSEQGMAAVWAYLR